MMDRIDELAEQLAQEGAAAKVAPSPWKMALLWFGAAAIYLLTALLLFGLRSDWELKLHDLWYLAEISSLTALLAASSYSAALLSYPDLHQHNHPSRALLITLGVFLLVLAGSWFANSPPAPLPVHSLQCSIDISWFAVMPALLLILSMRRFASTHQRRAGSVALLFAFSTGAIWLRLYELNDSISHVLLWHYLPLLSASILGLWLGRWFLRW